MLYNSAHSMEVVAHKPDDGYPFTTVLAHSITVTVALSHELQGLGTHIPSNALEVIRRHLAPHLIPTTDLASVIIVKLGGCVMTKSPHTPPTPAFTLYVLAQITRDSAKDHYMIEMVGVGYAHLSHVADGQTNMPFFMAVAHPHDPTRERFFAKTVVPIIVSTLTDIPATATLHMVYPDGAAYIAPSMHWIQSFGGAWHTAFVTRAKAMRIITTVRNSMEAVATADGDIYSAYRSLFHGSVNMESRRVNARVNEAIVELQDRFIMEHSGMYDAVMLKDKATTMLAQLQGWERDLVLLTSPQGYYDKLAFEMEKVDIPTKRFELRRDVEEVPPFIVYAISANHEKMNGLDSIIPRDTREVDGYGARDANAPVGAHASLVLLLMGTTPALDARRRQYNLDPTPNDKSVIQNALRTYGVDLHTKTFGSFRAAHDREPYDTTSTALPDVPTSLPPLDDVNVDATLNTVEDFMTYHMEHAYIRQRLEFPNVPTDHPLVKLYKEYYNDLATAAAQYVLESDILYPPDVDAETETRSAQQQMVSYITQNIPAAAVFQSTHTDNISSYTIPLLGAGRTPTDGACIAASMSTIALIPSTNDDAATSVSRMREEMRCVH